jgi:CelD/BcsL family acetyltransferase involved in cellulose biosynthesis
MADAGCRVQVITDPENLLSLRAEWDDLYARADSPRLSQSFEWAWCAWETVAKPVGSRLLCVFVRESTRPVLIWPMVVSRHRRFWTAATALAAPEDWFDVLVEPVPEQLRFARLAWSALLKCCHADFIHLERMKTGSLPYQVMNAESATTVEVQAVPLLTWDAFSDWDAYWTTVPRRKSVDRCHRKLSKFGNISFEIASTSERRQEFIDWMFRQKMEWARRKGIRYSLSIGVAPYEAFLSRASETVSKFGTVTSFALLLDRRIIAVQICAITPHGVAARHIAYDFDYARFYPSLMLDKEVLRWTFDRRLPYDFDVVPDHRKDQLSRGDSIDVATLNYYLTAWGRVYEHARIGWNSAVVRKLRSDMLRPKASNGAARAECDSQ